MLFGWNRYLGVLGLVVLFILFYAPGSSTANAAARKQQASDDHRQRYEQDVAMLRSFSPPADAAEEFGLDRSKYLVIDNRCLRRCGRRA